MSNLLQELIDARVNGNKIEGNEIYIKMLKRVSFSEISAYAKMHKYKWDIDDLGKNKKIDLIEIIKNNIDAFNRANY